MTGSLLYPGLLLLGISLVRGFHLGVPLDPNLPSNDGVPQSPAEDDQAVITGEDYNQLRVRAYFEQRLPGVMYRLCGMDHDLPTWVQHALNCELFYRYYYNSDDETKLKDATTVPAFIEQRMPGVMYRLCGMAHDLPIWFGHALNCDLFYQYYYTSDDATETSDETTETSDDTTETSDGTTETSDDAPNLSDDVNQSTDDQTESDDNITESSDETVEVDASEEDTDDVDGLINDTLAVSDDEAEEPEEADHSEEAVDVRTPENESYDFSGDENYIFPTFNTVNIRR